MPGQAAQAGLLRRIRASTHRLTLSYAPALSNTVGATPVFTAPESPLTGRPVPLTAVPLTVLPSKPDATAQCLWYDALTLADTPISKDTRSMQVVGWREGAAALACVWLADVLTSAAAPYGPTTLSDAAAVTHGGTRYHILAQERIAGGGAAPYALYVWLASAVGQ